MIFFLKDGTNDFHLHIPQKRKYNLMRCSIHNILKEGRHLKFL